MCSAQAADYNSEFAALGTFVTDTATKTFNGTSLFTTAGLDVTTDGSGGTYTMSNVSMAAGTDYAVAAGKTISTTTTAAAALTAVTAAIGQLGTDRAKVGASEQFLNSTNQQLGVLGTNLSAANSQISDVDVATESTKYAKYQILVQSGTAMLAQANQNPQSVLKLLQNA